MHLIYQIFVVAAAHACTSFPNNSNTKNTTNFMWTTHFLSCSSMIWVFKKTFQWNRIMTACVWSKWWHCSYWMLYLSVLYTTLLYYIILYTHHSTIHITCRDYISYIYVLPKVQRMPILIILIIYNPLNAAFNSLKSPSLKILHLFMFCT